MTSTTPDAPATTPTPAPLTARDCAAHAADTLSEARACAGNHPDGSEALARVAEGWRSLGETIARTPLMAPARRTDDDR